MSIWNKTWAVLVTTWTETFMWNKWYKISGNSVPIPRFILHTPLYVGDGIFVVWTFKKWLAMHLSTNWTFKWSEKHQNILPMDQVKNVFNNSI